MKKLTVIVLVLSIMLTNCTTTDGSTSGDSQLGNSTSSNITPGHSPSSASEYFVGAGGSDMSLAILVPQGKGLESDLDYLPVVVQGDLVADIGKYSGISVLDRENLEKIMQETENDLYDEENYFVRYGQVAGTDYLMTGEITKTSSGYTLQLRVGSTSDGRTKAMHSVNCTVAELDNFKAIKVASEDILTQMGVTLTERARTELAGAAMANDVNAQTALAKGIIAQQNGTVVESLAYYIQSTNYDPALNEAASRLNILQADITSGSMGQNVRNDIQWRNQWIARLTEAEQFYSNYMKQTLPYCLVYSANLKQGSIDYARETVDLSGVTVELVPDARWFFNAPVQMINVVSAGLLATGQTRAWNLNWPANSVAGGSFADRNDQFSVVVELLNDQGVSIGSQTVTLRGGFYVNSNSPFKIRPNMSGPQSIGFSRVNANLISDRLSVRIKSINGVDAASAVRDKLISILTEADYVRLPEVIAGADSRSITANPLFTVDNSGIITGYKGSGGAVVIPSYIAWEPVTGIGKEVFAYKNESPGTGFFTGTTITFYIGKGLTSVVIPDTVTTIGSGAFANNKLTNVIIPNSVKLIEDNAFSHNQLTSMVIPNSVTSIGASAFADNQLTNVVIPNSVTSIGASAFADNQLTSVVIPNSVTAIDFMAFANNQLTSVVIPNSVTNFGREVIINQPMAIVRPGESPTFSNKVIPPKTEVDRVSYDVFFNNPLISITLPAYLAPCKGEPFSVRSTPNQDGLFAFYYKNIKRAGVYTRPTTESKKWSYKKP